MKNEKQEEIQESLWRFIDATREKYALASEEVLDLFLETLEAANIPEEESEQVRARALDEGKTFSQKVTEYVVLGLEEDDDFDRAKRLAELREHRLRSCPRSFVN